MVAVESARKKDEDQTDQHRYRQEERCCDTADSARVDHGAVSCCAVLEERKREREERKRSQQIDSDLGLQAETALLPNLDAL